MRQRIYTLEAEHRSKECRDSVALFHHTEETHSYLDLTQISDEQLLAFFHELPIGAQIKVTFEVVESE